MGIQLLFTVDPLLVVQLIVAVLLPIAVGFVTLRTTSSKVKAILLAVFTLVSTVLTGLIAALTAQVPFDVGLALISAIPSFCISVATHFGLWKPTGLAAAAQDVEATTVVK